MKITVFGAGAMGSLYGARLARAGHDVAIVARGARREAIERAGLRIRRQGTTDVEVAEVAVVARPEERPAELVVVLVRRQQVDGVLESLAGSKDDVAMMVNVASGYARWHDALGKRLMIGFPGATGTFAADGVVDYQIAPALVQPTVVGEPDGPPTPRITAFAHALRDAGFPVQVRDDIDFWQRTHAAWIAPFMLAAANAEGDDARFAEPGNLGRCVDAIREALALLEARGVPPTPPAVALVTSLPRALLVGATRTFLRLAPKQRAHFVAAGAASRDEALVLVDELLATADMNAPRPEALLALAAATRSP